MAVAGGAVPSCRVWLDDTGKLHSANIILRQRETTLDNLEEAVKLMRKREQVVVRVEGATLLKLRNMVHGGTT